MIATTFHRPPASTRAHAGLGVPVAAMLALFFAYGLASTPGLWSRWGLTAAALPVAIGWLGAASLALPLLRRAPGAAMVAALIALALALRIGVAALLGGHAPVGDALIYPELARGLLDGRGLVVSVPGMGPDLRAVFPPLYPLLLAGWQAVAGASPTATLLFGFLMDVGAAALLLKVADQLGIARAGRAAAWAALIWPAALLSAPFAEKESLCALLVLALAAVWLDDRLLRRGWPLGLAAGLLALTQPGFAPLAALFGIAAWPRLGAAGVLRAGLRAVPVALLVMLPWWVRNALLFHAFVPLTTSGGIGLWVGNNPHASGGWMPPPPGIDQLPERAMSAAAGHIATDWIAHHPLDAIRLNVAKLFRVGGVAQVGLVRMAAMRPPVPTPVLAALFPIAQASWLGLLALAAHGAWRSRGGTLMLLVVACLVQLCVFGVPFEFAERHREFATPLLLLLAFYPWGSTRDPSSPAKTVKRAGRPGTSANNAASVPVIHS